MAKAAAKSAPAKEEVSKNKKEVAKPAVAGAKGKAKAEEKTNTKKVNKKEVEAEESGSEQ